MAKTTDEPRGAGGGQPRRAGRVARLHASASVRGRWLLLGAWAVLLVLLLADGVPSFGRDGLTLRELAPADAPELATELESARLFRVPLTGRVQVVRRDADGLPRRLQRADVEAALRESREEQEQGRDGPVAFRLPYANTFGIFPASSELSTTTLVHHVGYPDATLRSRERAAQAAAAEARERGRGRVSVTGGIPAQLETGRVIRGALATLQLASVVVLVLITAAWFRALLPPLIVLATIGVTMLMLLEALAAAARVAGAEVPAEVLPVVLVVAIGVATDYALFHVAAWRRMVAGGVDPAQATVEAIAVTSPVVLTAGITTGLGATSLRFAETAFVAAFAPALVVAVGVALLVGLLLVPALVAVAGPRLGWPRPARPLHPPRWRRQMLAAATRRGRRVPIVTVIVLLFVVVGSQARSAPSGFNIISGLPDDHPISVGASDASAGFAPGVLSPTLLLVEGEELDERSAQLARFSVDVAAMDGVAGVLGPDVLRSSIERAGLGEEAARLELELLGAFDGEEAAADDPEADAAPASRPSVLDRRSSRGVLVTADGRYARLVVVLDADPYTGTAVDQLRTLRPRLRAALDDAGLEQASLRVAGDTAVVERVVDQLDRDLLTIAAILVPFELVVLVLFLRSLLVAAVVVASSLVTTLVALGVLSLHDRLLGPGDGVAFFVPVATFVLLLSIGADYGVLMGSALRDARSRGLDGVARARDAMSAAGPTIVLAGLVLASTFALLAVVPLGAFEQFAIAMGTGVLVDTLVVRPLLMPLLLARGSRHTTRGAA